MANLVFGLHRRTFLGAGGSVVALAACGQGGGAGGQGQPPAPSVSDVQAGVLTKALQDVPSHGFQPNAFGDPASFQGDPGHARLRVAMAAYARALHGLAIPKAQMSKDWGLKRAPYDADKDLAQALAQNRLDDWLKSLPPPQPEYQVLRGAYVRYLKLGEAGWPTLPDDVRFRRGVGGPEVQALRERLAAEDTTVQPGDAPFDQPLAEAVQRFQTANGLKPTGQVDKDTLAALNVPAKARAAQVRANLERWRWMPRDTPATRVDVNTAATTFDYFEDNQPRIHTLAAAGKPGDETPILTSQINSVILNPPWRVPDDIADKELFPKEAAHPGYFASHDFVVNPAGEHVKLMQKAGPQSALGYVKFQFPSAYAVYLHDTPSKAAFDQNGRSVSHGCVRLEHAVDFAKYLLSKEPNWPADRVDEVIGTRNETAINLTHDVPVRLMYWTAFPTGFDDQVAFRPDVYGWDEQVLRLLDAQRSGQG